MRYMFEYIILISIVFSLAIFTAESYNEESRVITITETYDEVADSEVLCDCLCDTCVESIDSGDEVHPCDCNFSDAEEYFTQEEIAEMRLNQ